jgi:hypothetical protein
MIFGNICIHDAAETVVDERFLKQRHCDAPHYAAEDLAARGFRVENTAGRDRADDASDADDVELLVRLHFGKDRRVRIVRT